MIIHRIGAALAALTLLGACVETTTGTADPNGAGMRDVPEEIAAIAAPYQDLSSVRVLEDGCYWYRHVGPVETTLLPLRTTEGRPICARPREEAPPATG